MQTFLLCFYITKEVVESTWKILIIILRKKRLQMYQLHCNNGTWWSGKDIVLYLLNNQMKLIPLYPYVAEITLDSVRFFKEINKGLTKRLKCIFWINIQRKKFAGVTSFKRLGDLKQYDHKKLIFIVSRVIFCSVICFVARDTPNEIPWKPGQKNLLSRVTSYLRSLGLFERCGIPVQLGKICIGYLMKWVF